MEITNCNPNAVQVDSALRNPSKCFHSAFSVNFDACGIYFGPLYIRVFRVFRRPPLYRSIVGRVSPFPLHDLLLQLGVTLCIFVFVGCRA